MKKIKFIVPALAIVIIIGVLAAVFIGKSGDGNSSHSDYKQPKTVTLKEYLDGGPRVFFCGYLDEIGKDNEPGMILLENGQLYETYYSSGFISLKLGEISKMTDEELADYVRNNGEYMGEYQLHIYTDKTGNYLEYERVEIEKDGFTFYPYTFTTTVYDSVFQGFYNINSSSPYGYFYRVNDDITVTLDNIGDEGVEVD